MRTVINLLRPRLMSLRNRILKESSSYRGQAITVLSLSSVIMIALFLGTRWALEQLSAIPFLVYVPPSLPLSMMLMVLMIMSSITALAASLGSFFLAEDLELLLASPTPMTSLFLSRFVTVVATIAWMPFVFILPVLGAMAMTYHPGPYFLLAAIGTLIPYFVIPAAFGTLGATVFISTVSQRWTKIIVRVLLLGGLGLTMYIAHTLANSLVSNGSEGHLLHLMRTVSMSQSSWLPSAWVATVISELLVPTGKTLWPRLLLIYSTATLVLGLSHMAFHILHAHGFSRAISRRSVATQKTEQRPARRASSLGQPLALVLKESRVLSRDVTQSAQLLFLCVLCLFYVGNIRTFSTVFMFSSEPGGEWHQVFFVIHTAITAFFTSAVTTRLVFPSMSLEGKSYWMIKTAPIAMRDVLLAKFYGWLIPVSVLSAALLAIGTFSLIGRWEISLVYFILSFFVSYGIVGLGTGLGAYFADFSWDNPAQLALSVGSFIFMLCSAILIMLNIFPFGILLRVLLTNDYSPTRVALGAVIMIAIAAMNVTAAQVALRMGERAVTRLEG